MLIYVMLLALTVLGCIYAGDNRKREIEIGFAITCFCLVLCGLRGLYCGTDNINYLFRFNSGYHPSQYEVGFLASMKIIRNFHLWLFLYAAATYLIFFFQIKKETRYICIALLIYIISPSNFFSETFNIIRQALAASLMLWSFVSWNSNKRLEALFALLIAMTFHASSVIALPLLFLKNLRIPFCICIVGLVGTLILGAKNMTNQMLQLFTLGLEQYSFSDTTTQLADKYAAYGQSSFSYNLTGILATTFPITCLAILSYPFSEESKRKYGMYYNIFVVATMLGNVFIPAMQYGFRLVYSLQIVQPLVVAMAYQYGTPKIRQLFRWLFWGIALIWLYVMSNLPSKGIHPIVPYKFIDDIQFVIDSFHP